MARHTLQQGQGITHPITGLGSQGRRGKHRINCHYFLKERCHRSDGMPENGSEIGKDFALLTELHEGGFALGGGWEGGREEGREGGLKMIATISLMKEGCHGSNGIREDRSEIGGDLSFLTEFHEGGFALGGGWEGGRKGGREGGRVGIRTWIRGHLSRPDTSTFKTRKHVTLLFIPLSYHHTTALFLFCLLA